MHEAGRVVEGGEQPGHAVAGRDVHERGAAILHDQVARVEEHLGKSLDLLRAAGAVLELLRSLQAAADWAEQQGNTEQARESLTQALEIFERLGTLIEPDKVREELDKLPDG